MNEFVVRLNNKIKNIKIIDDSIAEIDGVVVKYKLINIDNKSMLLKINNKLYESAILTHSNEESVVSVNGASILTKIRTSLEEKAFQLISFSKSNTNNKIEVKSPMPGLVLKVKKQKGESIKKGEAVLILEAMKMENEIKSPADGILEEIFVKEGTAIEKNISLFTVK